MKAVNFNQKLVLNSRVFLNKVIRIFYSYYFGRLYFLNLVLRVRVILLEVIYEKFTIKYSIILFLAL